MRIVPSHEIVSFTDQEAAAIRDVYTTIRTVWQAAHDEDLSHDALSLTKALEQFTRVHTTISLGTQVL